MGKGLVIFIVLILIIGGLISYCVFFKGGVENASGSQEEREAGLSINYCQNLNNEATLDEEIAKYNCYGDLAIEENDLEICNLIPLYAKGGSANLNRYVCYKQIAILRKDISICGTIPDKITIQGTDITSPYGGREGCYKETALEKKDSSVCEGIENSDDKDQCYLGSAVGEQDGSVCEKIVYSITKYYCYKDVSAKTGDKTLCENIKHKNIKSMCLGS